MAVEMVLITPVLFAFVLLIVAFGRLVSVQGDVESAARDAARAASLAPTKAQAGTAARSTLAASLDDDTVCANPDVNLDRWEPDGVVTVTLNCTITMSDLGVPGLNKQVAVDATSAVPLDPYRSYS